MNKFFLSFIAFCFCGMAVWAQTPHCATDHLHQQFIAQNPDAARYQEEMERLAVQMEGTESRGGIRIIPCVVHVIQSTPSIEISDARVQSQIDVLNEDFRLMNSDTNLIPTEFQSVKGDVEIEFCLATIDPNGCPTTGINRVVSPSNAVHNSNASAALKGLIQWDPYRYMNIWVPEEIVGGILGYATFPTSLAFNPGSDGVVINGQNFGRGNGTPNTPFNLGRTGTHEVGHWLGLRHTFEGGCSGMTQSTCNTQGDRICDTPPTATSNFGCPNTQNTCNETFPSNLNDMTMNYMDYVDDRCMYMFTQGQADRMNFNMSNIRAQIWSPANLTATGCDGTVSPGCAPSADFEANVTSICVGEPVSFSDLSIGPATSWSWTFNGGTPATSNQANPQVSYATPGVYGVTLQVTNALGNDTEIKNGYIEVIDPIPAPLTESFEGIIQYPQGWFVNTPVGVIDWELTTSGASDGNNAMFVDNFQVGSPGSMTELISIPFDLTNMTDPKLIWDRAYKRFNAFQVDTLRIHISGDCGNTWNLEWEGAGPTLITTGGIAVAAPFVPNANQWLSDTLDLNAYTNSDGVRIRFQFVSGDGQNLYIDHLRMDGLVSRAEPNDLQWSMQVVNPFQDALQIEYQLETTTEVEFRLSDLHGRVISSHRPGIQNPGNYQLNWNANAISGLASGVYFLEGLSENGRVSRKVIKY